METLRFGRLTIGFDGRVLRPRPWTLAQSRWAAEVSVHVPPGPILELCAGVGHIGLAAAADTGRDLVLVDANELACGHAQRNADSAGLSVEVDVRCGPFDAVLEPAERFPLVVADPPWVPSAAIERFPEDPVDAIDGGADGLEVARACVVVIGRHLAPNGTAILQLGTPEQAATLGAELERGAAAEWERGAAAGLQVAEVRTVPDANGVLVRLVERG
jgi:methylase of polypeptide subunit release factors